MTCFCTEIFSADWSGLTKREPPMHIFGAKKRFQYKNMPRKTIYYCATWNAASPHSSSKVKQRLTIIVHLRWYKDLGTRTHIYENNGTLANMKRANKQAKTINCNALYCIVLYCIALSTSMHARPKVKGRLRKMYAFMISIVTNE